MAHETDQKDPSIDVADVESIAMAGVKKETAKLAGLADLDGIQRSWNLKSLIVIWISALLMSFATNLNNQTSASFTSYATSSFASAPLLGTITVVQAVVSSVALQPLARLADVYGLVYTQVSSNNSFRITLMYFQATRGCSRSPWY